MTAKISDIQNRPLQTGAHKKLSDARDAGTQAPSAEAATATGGVPVQITDQARQLA